MQDYFDNVDQRKWMVFELLSSDCLQSNDVMDTYNNYVCSYYIKRNWFQLEQASRKKLSEKHILLRKKISNVFCGNKTVFSRSLFWIQTEGQMFSKKYLPLNCC